MSSDEALVALRTHAKTISLSLISGSDKSIRLSDDDESSFPFDTKLTFNAAGKTLSYSLISLFILVQDPSLSVLKYRQTCKKYSVDDVVKVSDKSAVLGYFLEGGDGSVSDGVSSKKDDKQVDKKREGRERSGREKERSSSHRKDKSHKSSSSKRRDEDGKDGSSTKKKEKESKPMTHQQIMDNLKTVVDKRADRAKKQTSSDKDDGGDATMAVVDAEMMVDAEDAGGEGEAATGGETGTSSAAASATAIGEETPALLSQEEEERRAIRACLSPAGYEATEISKEDLEKDRVDVEKIMSFEIPVGNSASILRCGVTAGNTTSSSSSKRKSSSSQNTNSVSERNFGRVLELYSESLKERHNEKRDAKKSKYGHKRGGNTSSKNQKPPKPTGKPIIIVPNAMTSPITLINANQFFGKSTFVPRDVAMKQLNGPKPTSITIKRNISSRLGGGAVEYEIIDNPSRKLVSSKDWDRVVAVIAQGAAWQFKGWKMGGRGGNSSSHGDGGNPVDVFSNSFGYYISFEGAPVPKELQGWNVLKGYLSKDKRGLDSVVFASFWNGLDEWMGVHKRGYLPV